MRNVRNLRAQCAHTYRRVRECVCNPPAPLSFLGTACRLPAAFLVEWAEIASSGFESAVGDYPWRARSFRRAVRYAGSLCVLGASDSGLRAAEALANGLFFAVFTVSRRC